VAILQITLLRLYAINSCGLGETRQKIQTAVEFIQQKKVLKGKQFVLHRLKKWVEMTQLTTFMCFKLFCVAPFTAWLKSK